MRKATLPALGLITLLSACNTGFVDSDVERGLAGAAAGAVIAKGTGGDGGTGAVIGGLAGVFCDDAGVCSRSR
ncbi:MAG: hypothetical protein AAFY65_10780 [Pseudomonadota bacterium]